MSWAELHLDRGEWRIQETKNGTPQTVPLVPGVVDILRNRKELAECAGEPYVFPGSGQSGQRPAVGQP